MRSQRESVTQPGGTTETSGERNTIVKISLDYINLEKLNQTRSRIKQSPKQVQL